MSTHHQTMKTSAEAKLAKRLRKDGQRRQARCRARRRNGLMLVTLELDQESTIHMLLREGLLSVYQADDRDAVAEALKDKIEVLSLTP
jgi:hypothetical protein